jgi:3-deoxy-D-manno-octulosonic-acid transferase
MAWFVYYCLMYLFVAGIHVWSFWNKKAEQWVSGRKNWVTQLQQLPAKKNQRIWFHVSSLGEFEQARPVIEKLKEKNNELDIILTFFSPSGYTIRSAYSQANVYYLPADIPGNAAMWVDIVKPDFAVFVKYDLWPGYLRALVKRKIPAVLISAHWKRSHKFSSWNLPPTKALLYSFKQIFLQQGDDLDYFRSKGFLNLSIAGDTRIDRSLQLPMEAASKIPDALKNLPPFDLVAGSTWPGDEKRISEAIQQLNLKLLIAPHDTSEESIERVVNAFPFPVTKLSSYKQEDPLPKVMIVDSIGLLAYVYSLGKIAYVGGGFGAGIHNTLEPMAHGKPLIFGPAFGKFPEAVTMVEEKAAISINTTDELIKAINLFNQSDHAKRAGTIAYRYLVDHRGASDKVVNYIAKSIRNEQKV